MCLFVFLSRCLPCGTVRYYDLLNNYGTISDRSASPEPAKRKAKTTHDEMKVSKTIMTTPVTLTVPRITTAPALSMSTAALLPKPAITTKQTPSPTMVVKQSPNMRFDDIKKYSTSASPTSLPSSTSPSPNPSAPIPPLVRVSDDRSSQPNSARALQLPLPHEPSNIRLQAQLFSQSTTPAFNDVSASETPNAFEYPPLNEGTHTRFFFHTNK